jgi:ribosomal protein S18 acetylase RimI-like enzyme
MREAGLHDLSGIYSVCIKTGDAGNDASHLHDNVDLLGHTFAGPYLAADPTSCLVVVDAEGVAGFLLATADTAAFEQWRERVWLPPLRAQYPLGSGTARDHELTALLHRPPSSPAVLLPAYPAHLHINLLPRLHRQGWGRRLVEELERRLGDRCVPGIHLGVGLRNPRAIGFYERLGFTEQLRDDHVSFMVKPIVRTTSSVPPNRSADHPVN